MALNVHRTLNELFSFISRSSSFRPAIMELAMHPLHDPHGLNGMMDDVPYPSRGTRHSELSNALGGITLRRPELDWIDQGHTAPHRAPPHDHSLHPPQAVVSASAFTHGVPRELNADVSPASHGPAGPGAYNLGNPNYTESTSTLWTTARGPLSGDYNTYEHNDFSHTPLFHPVPRTLGSTYKFMEPGAGEPSDHWTATAAQAQDTLEAMEPEPHQSDGFSVGCFQETDRDGHPPSSRILPSCAAVPSPPKPPPSTIQYGLEDAAEIHKHMRRSVGGGATCAWAHGDGECGYSSHVDLVKRHIKRVHYRLK